MFLVFHCVLDFGYTLDMDYPYLGFPYLDKPYSDRPHTGNPFGEMEHRVDDIFSEV